MLVGGVLTAKVHELAAKKQGLETRLPLLVLNLNPKLDSSRVLSHALSCSLNQYRFFLALSYPAVSLFAFRLQWTSPLNIGLPFLDDYLAPLIREINCVRKKTTWYYLSFSLFFLSLLGQTLFCDWCLASPECNSLIWGIDILLASLCLDNNVFFRVSCPP